MKVLPYLTALLLSSISLVSTAQDCSIPDVLLQNYQKDVSHLALLYLENTNAPEANEAVIPQETQSKFWSDLAAIFNSNSPESKEVFDAHCIHHEPSSSKINQHLYVNVNENASWYQNWMDNNITTNIGEIDDFFQRYNFELIGTLGSTFKIKTEDLYNLQPLVDTISTFDGVNFSEIAPYIGDGNWIVHTEDGDNDLYDFYLRWGDCPAGCIWSYKWTFQVEADCAVSFLGTEWDNPDKPDPVNCNISAVTNLDELNNSLALEIIPNPAMDYININIKNENAGLQSFKIFDVLGNVVRNGKIRDQLHLDIQHWENGIYYLRIASQELAYKIVKQ